jgi:hypothetical protein
VQNATALALLLWDALGSRLYPSERGRSRMREARWPNPAEQVRASPPLKPPQPFRINVRMDPISLMARDTPLYTPDDDRGSVRPFRKEGTILAQFFDGGEGLTTCSAHTPAGEASWAYRTMTDQRAGRAGRVGPWERLCARDPH